MANEKNINSSNTRKGKTVNVNFGIEKGYHVDYAIADLLI